MKKIRSIFVLFVLCSCILAGCTTVVAPPHAGPQRVWVPGHHNPNGTWMPGHWRRVR